MPCHSRALLLATCSFALFAGCAPADAPATNAPSATPDASAPPAAAASVSTLTDPGSGRCDGKDVRISDDDFQLVFDDACGAIVITGSHGALNVEKAQSIRVEGSDVTVLNSDVDTLTVTGSDNRLNLTRFGSATIEGNGNGLLGQECGAITFRGHDNYANCDNEPAVEDSGTGNRSL